MQYVRLTEKDAGRLVELANGRIYELEFISPTGMDFDKRPRINGNWYAVNGQPIYWSQHNPGLVAVRVLEKENIVPFVNKKARM